MTNPDTIIRDGAKFMSRIALFLLLLSGRNKFCCVADGFKSLGRADHGIGAQGLSRLSLPLVSEQTGQDSNDNTAP